MSLTFPNESPAYRAARDRLLAEEVALRRQMEAVASARRALPLGGAPPSDYAFESSAATTLKLSELFGGRSSLAIYSMMFPRDRTDRRPGAPAGETALLPLEEAPCPSCAALLDQLDGAAEHVAPYLSLVVVAQAPIERVLAFARERHWTRLRFLSARQSTYNRDYHGDENGAPRPMMNVFAWNGGEVRHTWGSELLYAPSDPDQDPRHLGTIEPMWNLFDLTPEGRGASWEEQLSYPCEHCKVGVPTS